MVNVKEMRMNENDKMLLSDSRLEDITTQAINYVIETNDYNDNINVKDSVIDIDVPKRIIIFKACIGNNYKTHTESFDVWEEINE